MTIPHDPDLEQRYVAALLAGWATDDSLDPDDLYTPHLQALAHAHQTLPQPPGRHYQITPGNRAILIIPGLREALLKMGTPDAARLAGHGYGLATNAAVTTHADVERLRELAATRRELAEIDIRRAQLLEAG